MSTQEIIEKYNEMLHDGKYTFEQAYGWMMMEKNKQDYEFYLKQECIYVMIMHFYTQKVFVVMEKCDSWNCPFCNLGYCTGDKEYAYEMHFCTKQNLNSEYDYE